MKKIVYISTIAYSDVDISFLSVAQKKLDITYIITVGIDGKQGCALDLRESRLVPGLNPATEIPYMSRYKGIIDLHKVYVFYKTSRHAYQFKSLLQERFLYRFIKKGGFSVVHITSFPSLLNPFYFLLRRHLILTVHDPLPHFDNNYRMDKYNRLVAFKYIRNFILLNEAQRSTFIDYYHLTNKNISIFSSSLSSYTYLNIYTSKRPAYVKHPYILFFGNITPYKGVEYLLQAMDIVHETYPTVNLIIAGGGKFYFDISDYLAKSYLTIQNRFIPDDELSYLIKNCLFTVVPYVEATQSGVVMSSYAFFKPCVATNVGGLPEMVIDNKYGIVVEKSSSRALASAISELYGNNQKLTFYSEKIKEDYFGGEKSWDRISDNLKMIYNQI